MKCETLKVHDWEVWQTYRRDRGQPPWIKVHRSLMRDPKWMALSMAERGQLVTLWMIAADNDGHIIDDADLLSRMGDIKGHLDLNKFIDLGWLDATVASQRRQDDANVTTQRQSQKQIQSQNRRSPKGDSSKFDQFWNLYPRKVGKGAASKAWQKAITKIDPDTIIAAIDIQRGEIQSQFRGRGEDFRPHPTTWLNQERWTDQNDTTSNAQMAEAAIDEMIRRKDASEQRPDQGIRDHTTARRRIAPTHKPGNGST